MKVTILYSKLSGYAAACQKALKERGVELMVVHWPKADNAPFDESLWSFIDYRIEKRGLSYQKLLNEVFKFGPDLIIMSGWMDADYLKVSKQMRKKGVTVIAGTDTQWNGSFRQKIASKFSKFYLHPSIDILWVTGERQATLSKSLGFRGEKMWTGFYAADLVKFKRENPANSERANAFLFTGRFIPRKGIDLLIEAYKQYRNNVENPWELWMVGAGDLEHIVNGPGIKNLGFIQPDRIYEIYQNTKCFVLPSRKEPWGVVIQEAAASGLPVVASDICGASVHLVTDDFNGFVFESGNFQDLFDKMVKIHYLDPKEWEQYSNNSKLLADQYNPNNWAKKITDYLSNRC